MQEGREEGREVGHELLLQGPTDAPASLVQVLHLGVVRRHVALLHLRVDVSEVPSLILVLLIDSEKRPVREHILSRQRDLVFRRRDQ